MITLHQLLHRHQVTSAAKRRRKPRPVPHAQPPRGVVVEATKFWLGVSREMDAAIHATLSTEGLVPRRQDDRDEPADPEVSVLPSQASHVTERIRALLDRIVSQRLIVATIEHLGTRTASWSREQFTRQVKAAMGIDLLAAEPHLAPVLEAFRTRNLALVRSLAVDKVDRVRRVLEESGHRTRVEVIAQRITEETGATESRATLIARDQVLKLNGEVTQERHRQAGITEYLWSTSRDERVREGHAELEGTRHAYTDPPVVDPKTGRRGHPGEDYQCRCIADPVIEGFDEEPSAPFPEQPGGIEGTDEVPAAEPMEPRDTQQDDEAEEDPVVQGASGGIPGRDAIGGAVSENALVASRFEGAFRPNPGGEVRTIEEAVAIAARHGYEFDPEEYHVRTDETLPPHVHAEFIPTQDTGTRGEMIDWSDLIGYDGRIHVRLNPRIMGSDEHILNALVHERVESQLVQEEFRRNGGLLRLDRLRAIAHRSGTHHLSATEEADAVIERLRREDRHP